MREHFILKITNVGISAYAIYAAVYAADIHSSPHLKLAAELAAASISGPSLHKAAHAGTAM